MIYVFGSITRDYLFRFPCQFDTQVLTGDPFNLSLLVDHMVEVRGGTAANIAYNLRLLGVPVGIASAVGTDSQDYVTWLSSHHIQTDDIAVLEDVCTATAFIVTDSTGNQISIFFPGALEYVVDAVYALFDWTRLSMAIISAGTSLGLRYAVDSCLTHSVKYLYNPGQSVAGLTSHDLVKGITGASVLIVNEFELKQIENITGLGENEILDFGLLLVVTLGNRGSVLRQGGRHISVSAVQPVTNIDPTGAGDAYCAGLVKGLLDDQPLEIVGRVASLAASYSVEHNGPVEHSYEWHEFVGRYTLEWGNSYHIQ
ncbi:PfkB family carbohydrate kinase [Candidatus Poribacteria bacterium]